MYFVNDMQCFIGFIVYELGIFYFFMEMEENFIYFEMLRYYLWFFLLVEFYESDFVLSFLDEEFYDFDYCNI